MEQSGSERHASTVPDDTTRVPVTLAVFGASPVPAVAFVQRRTLVSRVGRAGLGLAVAWLLAFPAIFLPVLHFVLVPGLVIGGIVLAVHRMREDRRWRGSRVTARGAGRPWTPPLAGASDYPVPCNAFTARTH